MQEEPKIITSKEMMLKCLEVLNIEIKEEGGEKENGTEKNVYNENSR